MRSNEPKDVSINVAVNCIYFLFWFSVRLLALPMTFTTGCKSNAFFPRRTRCTLPHLVDASLSWFIVRMTIYWIEKQKKFQTPHSKFKIAGFDCIWLRVCVRSERNSCDGQRWPPSRDRDIKADKRNCQFEMKIMNALTFRFCVHETFQNKMKILRWTISVRVSKWNNCFSAYFFSFVLFTFIPSMWTLFS